LRREARAKQSQHELPAFLPVTQNLHGVKSMNLEDGWSQDISINLPNGIQCRFTTQVRGDEAIAIFYSLTEIVKAYKLNVLHYLMDVLERLPYCKTIEDYLALTPNRWKPSKPLY